MLDKAWNMSDLDEKPKVYAFPMDSVRACLLSELTLLAEAEAQVQEIPLPATPAALSTLSIRLDSLSVVDVTCALQPIVGFEPKDIVRTGGYGSIAEALDHMMPRLEAAWKKKHPVTA